MPGKDEEPIGWKCSADGRHWALLPKKECPFCIPIYAREPLLEEAAAALRQARLISEDWGKYTKGKTLLEKLINAGY